MHIAEMMRSLGESLGGGATVRNVYGEPVTIGGRTVIPVARVRYAFGAGGGSDSTGEPGRRGGGGGGGRVWAVPCGYVEITGGGSRFVPIHNSAGMALAALAGVAVGAAIVLGWSRD